MLYLPEVWISLIIILLLSQRDQAHLITSTWLPFLLLLRKFWVITTHLKIPFARRPPHPTHTCDPTLQQVTYFCATTSRLLYSLLGRSGSISFELFLILYLSYFLQLYSKKATFTLLNFRCLYPPFLCWKMC